MSFRDELDLMLKRNEVGVQQLQRRCFVASSVRNRAIVSDIVQRLRAQGWFAYDFTVAEFSLSTSDWDGLTYVEAGSHPAIAGAARSDLAMLRTLGSADVLLVVLPAGFSAGWETGFASARGALVVACGEIKQLDVPLLHADKICDSVDEAVRFLSEVVGSPSARSHEGRRRESAIVAATMNA